MKVESATVTSKWQITIPKKIRDVLKVGKGDQLDFIIQTNGQILVENKEVDVKEESVYNLVMMLVERKYPIVVKGSVAMGKTTFVKDLLLRFFTDKKVCIIEPREELFFELKEKMQDIWLLETNDIKIEQVIRLNMDIVIIDEAHLLNDRSLINKIQERGVSVIVVQQDFHLQEMKDMGDHYMIHADRREIANVDIIEQIKINSDGSEYTSLPLYKS